MGDKCVKCGLILPRLLECDHCKNYFCVVDLKAHAKEVTMNYVTIPGMVKS